jgi:uncharacterized protein YcfL
MIFQIITLVLMIALLSACSSTPRTFIAPKNATYKVVFEKAVEECALSAHSTDLSDLTKSKLTGTNETASEAMIGAASGLGVGTVLAASLLSGCAYNPGEFKTDDDSVAQEDYQKALNKCASFAKSIDISDPEALKLAKAGIGAMDGYFAGGLISLGAVAVSGMMAGLAVPFITFGVLGGSFWGAYTATSETKERDAVLIGCLQAKGYSITEKS